MDAICLLMSLADAKLREFCEITKLFGQNFIKMCQKWYKREMIMVICVILTANSCSSVSRLLLACKYDLLVCLSVKFSVVGACYFCNKLVELRYLVAFQLAL